MTEQQISAENTQTPESTQDTFHEYIDLQARLSVNNADALDPNESRGSDWFEVGEVNQELTTSLDLLANATLVDRKNYWEKTSVDPSEQLSQWKEEMVQVFAEKKDFFTTDEGKSWSSLYQSLGINPETFNTSDAEQIYETYFQGEEKASNLVAFADKASKHIFSNHDQRQDNLNAVAWISSIFGKDHGADLVSNFIAVDSLDKSSGDEFIEKVKVFDESSAVVSDREKELLTFLWENKGDIIQHDSAVPQIDDFEDTEIPPVATELEGDQAEEVMEDIMEQIEGVIEKDLVDFSSEDIDIIEDGLVQIDEEMSLEDQADFYGRLNEYLTTLLESAEISSWDTDSIKKLGIFAAMVTERFDVISVDVFDAKKDSVVTNAEPSPSQASQPDAPIPQEKSPEEPQKKVFESAVQFPNDEIRDTYTHLQKIIRDGELYKDSNWDKYLRDIRDIEPKLAPDQFALMEREIFEALRNSVPLKNPSLATHSAIEDEVKRLRARLSPGKEGPMKNQIDSSMLTNLELKDPEAESMYNHLNNFLRSGKNGQDIKGIKGDIGILKSLLADDPATLQKVFQDIAVRIPAEVLHGFQERGAGQKELSELEALSRQLFIDMADYQESHTTQ